MTLQEIVNNFKKKSWLRLCTLHSINKWDLIKLVKEPVYPGKHFIHRSPPITVDRCRLCKTEFDIGIYKDTFIAKKQCKCGFNGSQDMTVKKLESYYVPSICEELILQVNQNKTRALKTTLRFWKNQGLDEAGAIAKVSEIQAQRSKKSPAAQPGARGYSIRTIEYWLKKGYSEPEALKKLKETQTQNGLEYYVKKYGEEDGTCRYNNRIQRWLDSPNNKRMVKGRSKQSLALFEELGVGHYGDHEKTVRGQRKVHRVDFVFDNKIIEYFGDYWHGNPKKYSSTNLIRKKRVEDIWKHDQQKIEDLCSAGYDVLKVWESAHRQFPEEVLQLCKEFINDNSNITNLYSCEVYRRV